MRRQAPHQLTFPPSPLCCPSCRRAQGIGGAAGRCGLHTVWHRPAIPAEAVCPGLPAAAGAGQHHCRHSQLGQPDDPKGAARLSARTARPAAAARCGLRLRLCTAPRSSASATRHVGHRVLPQHAACLHFIRSVVAAVAAGGGDAQGEWVRVGAPPAPLPPLSSTVRCLRYSRPSSVTWPPHLVCKGIWWLWGLAPLICPPTSKSAKA